VLRAQIVLLAQAGQSTQAIAAALNLSEWSANGADDHPGWDRMD